MWIYVAAAAAAGIGALILWALLHRRKKDRMGIQPENAVIVKNGVDVYHQVVGSTKGEHFLKNDVGNGTILVKQGKNQPKKNQICLMNVNTGAQYRQSFREYLYIGRTGNGVTYDKLLFPEDSRISGTHCVIYGGDGVFYIKDLQSRNHTFVNGKMITDAVMLTNGDWIKIGNTSLQVYF